MRHGVLRFSNYDREDWEAIKLKWDLIDIDYYEPEVWG